MPARREATVGALARLAVDELRSAEAALDDDGPIHRRVHALRTALKKARALVRLCAPADAELARRVSRRLRRVAHAAAPARDAHVVLKTFDALGGGRRARERLARRARSATRALERERRALGRRLRRARGALDAWRDERSALAPRAALALGHERVRAAFARARATGGDDALHAWRRRVKAHAVQLEALGRPARDLDELGRLLGRDHDLALLSSALRRGERRRLSAAIASRRTRLQRRALALGARL
jgi:hypothetical protein